MVCSTYHWGIPSPHQTVDRISLWIGNNETRCMVSLNTMNFEKQICTGQSYRISTFNRESCAVLGVTRCGIPCLSRRIPQKFKLYVLNSRYVIYSTDLLQIISVQWTCWANIPWEVSSGFVNRQFPKICQHNKLFSHFPNFEYGYNEAYVGQYCAEDTYRSTPIRERTFEIILTSDEHVNLPSEHRYYGTPSKPSNSMKYIYPDKLELTILERVMVFALWEYVISFLSSS